MTEQEICEGNKLIAEFMGFKNTTPDDKDFDIYENERGDLIELMSVKYRSSWDCLMPVVRKIVNLCVDDGGDLFESDQYTSILDTIPIAEIESAYKVVVEFINWYNKNK